MLATYYHRTDYTGLVDIYIERAKAQLRAGNAECYCSNCVSSPDVMNAYYYSFMKNDNMEHGMRFLNLIESKAFCGVDYSAMGQKIIDRLEQKGISGNVHLLIFYLDSASLNNRKGKWKALYQEPLKVAIQKLKELDRCKYDSEYPYDLELKSEDMTLKIFLPDHTVNPEAVAFFEGLVTEER
jgi:hypothetical protein